MKTIQFLARCTLLIAVFTFMASATSLAADQDDVLVQKFITLSPGAEKEVNFYLNGVFDPLKISPMAFFMVITAGEAGVLSAEITIDPEEELDLEFTDVVSGSLIGIGISSEAATPVSGSAVEIPINSSFGVAGISAVITEKDTRYPLKRAIPCNVHFSLSGPEE